MQIFHGSTKVIEKPVFGFGKDTNDYGLGFYCTLDIELAKEWACVNKDGGFTNEYRLDTRGLKIKDLCDEPVISWVAVLLANRRVRYSNPLEKKAAEYIIAHFLPDLKDCDVIAGYRADDSYYSYARAFLSNTISLEQLEKAMHLGNLGMQFCLKSKKSFDRLSFVEAIAADGKVYFPKRSKRDDEARDGYYRLLEEDVSEGTFVRDIVNKELSLGDIRI